MTAAARSPARKLPANNQLRRLCRVRHKKKNWLFCWTELGAKHVGIVQSLIATCRMHDINPYDYFVDVLQRISEHPASLVHQLSRAFGSRCLPIIRSGQICMPSIGGVILDGNDRLRSYTKMRYCCYVIIMSGIEQRAESELPANSGLSFREPI